MGDGFAGGDAHCGRGSWGSSAPDGGVPSREDPTEPRRWARLCLPPRGQDKHSWAARGRKPSWDE